METSASSLNLSQVRAAVRRRALPAVLVLLGVATAAIVAAFVWPPAYSSTGTILIEQQELPSDLVRSTVSTYASQRVQTIAQRVMTTENLMGIIQRYNLYADMRKRQPREKVVAAMRKATNLQMISADVIDPRNGTPTKATIAFSLTFSNGSPQLAAQVANELVSLYLQQNIETRQKTAQDAVTFLSNESARLSREIDDLQGKVAAFRAKHENDLPELSQLNLTNLNRTQDEILETDTQLQAVEQQLVFLDAQLAQISPTSQIYDSTGQRVQSPADLLKTLRSQYEQAAAIYSPDHPDVVRLKREIAGVEASLKNDPSGTTPKDTSAADDRRQLQDAETQLDAAKHRYAPDHPDVIRLQKLVDALQQRVRAQPTPALGPTTAQNGATAPAPSSASAQTGAADSSTLGANPGADNPTYIQLRAQRQAALDQRKALQDKRAVLQRQYNDYEQRLARTPAVEREYSEMLGDLSSAQSQYAEMKRKQTEADIADNLETERKGERFSLIEPPLVPEEPTSPNRPLIIIFGLVAAIGLAGGTIALLEALDGSVHGRHELHQLVSVPPLAVIPHMLNSIDRAAQRRRRLYALIGTGAGFVLAMTAVHLFYRPLDVLWVVALRHLGVQT